MREELKGLLARVANLKGEDTITEILAALGRHDELKVDICAALLGEREDPAPAFETQYCVGDERPDMVLRMKTKTVLIESKFQAPLQPTQEQGYPKSITELSAPDSPCELRFLVPGRRKNEIIEHFKSHKLEVGVRTWEEVVAKLEKLQKTGPLSSREQFWLEEVILGIYELAGVVRLESFRQEELDLLKPANLGIILNRMLPYVDRLWDELGRDLQASFTLDGRRTSGRADGDWFYGFKLTPLTKQNIRGWIGVSTACPDSGPSIGMWLWSSEKGTTNLNSMLSESLSSFKNEYATRWVPFEIRPDVEGDTLIDEWLAQIKQIYGQLTAG